MTNDEENLDGPVYTNKQLELLEKWREGDLRRINILEGSVSSGKTWISLVLWAFWVATMPDEADSLYLMCAKSLTTLKRNCLLPLQSLIGQSNFEFSISSKEGKLFGRKILLEGANDAKSEGKIRGLTLQGAYVDEITKIPEDFFAMLLSRLRKDKAKLIGTTNPDSLRHWLKVNYLDRRDVLDLLDMRFVIDDNTFLPEDYVSSIKTEYTGVFYQRFIDGLWVLASGIIYPMYQDAIADPPEGSIAEDYRISLDYGTMNAFAAIVWEQHGKVWYATRSYYYSGRDTGITKTDEEYGRAMDALVLPIPFRKVKTIVDPSAASFITLLRKRDRFAVIGADNDVLDGIRETATAMQNGYIKISPRIKEFELEAAGYVWDDTAGDKERPVKVLDHCLDACRYFVKTMRIVERNKKLERRAREDAEREAGRK